MSKALNLTKPIPTDYDGIMTEALGIRDRLREIENDTSHLFDLENRMESAALNVRLADLWNAREASDKKW